MAPVSTITHDSRVSLRLMLAGCGGVLAAAGAWFHMTGLVRGLGYELRSINEKIDAVVVKQQEHVARAELRAWCREFKAANPSLFVPMPD